MMVWYLQGFASDEVTPSPDFRGNALFLGQLLLHTLSEKNRSLYTLLVMSFNKQVRKKVGNLPLAP